MQSKTTSRERATWLLVALLLGPGRAAAAGLSPADRRVLRGSSAQAVALVEDAERAAGAGRAREAWKLYGQAWALAPRSPVPPRGICRLALGLGLDTVEQRAAARAACQNAFMLGGTPEDMRNRAASAIGGSLRPTMDDLVAASLAAEAAERLGPGQVWGALARADLALRLGDRALLDSALGQVNQASATLVDGLPGTPRPAAWPAARVSGLIWFGRGLFALFLLVTAIDRLRARARRARRRPAPLLAGAALGSLLAMTGVAQAAPNRNAEPAVPVPTAAQQLSDPLGFANLVSDLSNRAETAAARGDHLQAARYWQALALVFPDRAFGFGKVCEELAAAGHRDQALAACRAAITRQEVSAADYTRLARVLLASEAPLTAAEHRQIDLVLQQLGSDPRAALIAERVRCDVAVHQHDRPALEACVAKLGAEAPGDARTIAFRWALAFEQGDRTAMQRLAADVRAAGLDAPTLARIDALTRAPGPRRAHQVVRAAAWGLGGALLTWILFRVAAAARRRVAALRRRTA